MHIWHVSLSSGFQFVFVCDSALSLSLSFALSLSLALSLSYSLYDETVFSERRFRTVWLIGTRQGPRAATVATIWETTIPYFTYTHRRTKQVLLLPYVYVEGELEERLHSCIVCSF